MESTPSDRIPSSPLPSKHNDANNDDGNVHVMSSPDDKFTSSPLTKRRNSSSPVISTSSLSPMTPTSRSRSHEIQASFAEHDLPMQSEIGPWPNHSGSVASSMSHHQQTSSPSSPHHSPRGSPPSLSSFSSKSPDTNIVSHASPSSKNHIQTSQQAMGQMQPVQRMIQENDINNKEVTGETSAANSTSQDIHSLPSTQNQNTNNFQQLSPDRQNLQHRQSQNDMTPRSLHSQQASPPSHPISSLSDHQTRRQNQNGNQNQQYQQQQQHSHEEQLTLQKFWRAYDDIIILSLFAIVGIVFRMISAAWFRLELGGVFSEDSALSTNLPLNCWSCFLMGILCSGRDAMGIVQSKIFGGANPYGEGRSILELGKGAYRGVVDAGRAGINRARGYGNLHSNNSSTHGGNNLELSGPSDGIDAADEPVRDFQSSPSSLGLHRRRSNRHSRNVASGESDQNSSQAISISNLSSPRRSNPSATSPRQLYHTSASIGNRDVNHLMSPAQSVESEDSPSIAGLLGLDEEFRIGAEKNGEDEIREVQLRALTRRILASPSLVFFPAKKEDVDVMEHYRHHSSSAGRNELDRRSLSVDLQPLQSRQNDRERLFQNNSSVPNDQFEIGDLNSDSDEESGGGSATRQLPASGEASGQCSDIDRNVTVSPNVSANSNVPHEIPQSSQEQEHHPSLQSSRTENERTTRIPGEIITSIEEELDEMFHSVSAQIHHFRRLNIADGWDVGTSAEEMKHDILLGLRVGFCGAVSTFSSWNSAMINLLKSGKVGTAIVGYTIGIQLGIISYRFGQHLAIYFFVWRCRRESKRDEKRGYGIRIRGSDSDISDGESARERSADVRNISGPKETALNREVASVRAIATSVFVMTFISLCSAIIFFPKHQQFSISLLFTPFGCLARWKLTKAYNKKGFPLGTFACNMLSCALSGSLGSWLAGNPGPEESIVLKSIIAGFAGSLSTFATFILELLALIDPIIFKFDGVAYAVVTILWGLIIGVCSSQAKNWADEI